LGRRARSASDNSADNSDEDDDTPTALEATASYSSADQRGLGIQSMRGGASMRALKHLRADDMHAWACFAKMRRNESDLGGDFVSFYHSYSSAALIYEVQAALAAVLVGFAAHRAPLPRLFPGDFTDTPDMASLLDRFTAEFAGHKRDHNAGFRKVALSAMCSYAARGPEMCVAKVWHNGYSCKDVAFGDIVKNMLIRCGFRPAVASSLLASIVSLADKNGLDTSPFGGRSCLTGQKGNLLQIFVRRDIVDEVAYASQPYGVLDKERMPLSSWLNGDNNFNYGQARLLARPDDFTNPSRVRMHVFSADPTFNKKRKSFQRHLQSMLSKSLSAHGIRSVAAEQIGSKPA